METPPFIPWASRGLRLGRTLESANIVRYEIKVGSVLFGLAVTNHDDKYDVSLVVALCAENSHPSTSFQLLTFRSRGATVELAAEEVLRDCDIRLLTLARELTWGLK